MFRPSVVLTMNAQIQASKRVKRETRSQLTNRGLRGMMKMYGSMSRKRVETAGTERSRNEVDRVTTIPEHSGQMNAIALNVSDGMNLRVVEGEGVFTTTRLCLGASCAAPCFSALRWLHELSY